MPDDRDTLRCADCGYRLRGTAGKSCPECGADVEESRQRVAAALPHRDYHAELHWTNIGAIFLPLAVVLVVFVLIRGVGLPDLAVTAALLSILSLVFAPILALVTMPWRGVYDNATSFGLRWRMLALGTEWGLLIALTLLVVLG